MYSNSDEAGFIKVQNLEDEESDLTKVVIELTTDL